MMTRRAFCPNCLGKGHVIAHDIFPPYSTTKPCLMCMGTGIVIESDEDMTGIDHPLRRLWMSSAEFLKRFDKYPGDKEAQRRVFNEEAYEFLCESIANEEILDELVAEAADVVVTVMTTLMAHGVSYSDFAAAIEQVAQKNDAKTHETHEINSQGKIARKK